MAPKRKPSSATSKNQPEKQKPKLQPQPVPVSVSVSEEQPDSESDFFSESEDESTKRESIRKLLEPFSKDQLIELFATAASNDPSLLSRVKTLANTDPAHRKIFVHGLGYDATTEQLLNAFKPYGEIEECRLITDKVTGRAKGYGFVLYKTRVGAKKALKEPQKKIGNRNTSCQLAAVGPVGAGSDSGGSSRKIYVGNVGQHVTVEKLRAFFANFGEIEEGPLGVDSVSKKFKGFAIFVYKTVEGFNKALEEPVKMFDGCQLYCKKFVENLNNNNSNASISKPTQVVLQNDSTSYGFGLSPGVFGGASMMNATPLLMNPVLGFNPSFGGIGAGYGINSISPGVIGSYGVQPALQGLGTYPSAQMVQPSFGGTATMATLSTPAKDSSGIGLAAAYPSYLGR